MNRAATSQTAMERERQRRICVALWAYAYEIEADPLVPDARFDAVAAEIDLQIATDRPELDAFFRAEFTPDTGAWVHRHPDLHRLRMIYQRLRRRPLNAEKARPPGEGAAGDGGARGCGGYPGAARVA